MKTCCLLYCKLADFIEEILVKTIAGPKIQVDSEKMAPFIKRVRFICVSKLNLHDGGNSPLRMISGFISGYKVGYLRTPVLFQM